MREFLLDTIAFISPAHGLEGLSVEDAERKIADAPHSIAEIVAHMTFWATWFQHRCTGVDAPMVASASEGWPAVAPGSWPQLERQFLDTMERLAALGDDRGRLEAPLSPPIDFPPLAHYTTRDALVHVATHGAHHLGQIVLLRQLMKRWPPPAGSWTW